MDKSSLTVFPYYKNSQGDYYPIVPLVLWHGLQKLNTDALIDSGATISIFQPAIAEFLGIKIESGKEIFEYQTEKPKAREIIELTLLKN